jgi:hypothetical protein
LSLFCSHWPDSLRTREEKAKLIRGGFDAATFQVSLSLLLSNQQSLPRALTELMLDQTRARARVSKRALEHMMYELQQTELVYAAHTIMPLHDDSRPDHAWMDTARSSTTSHKLTLSQRSAEFGACDASSYRAIECC